LSLEIDLLQTKSRGDCSCHMSSDLWKDDKQRCQRLRVIIKRCSEEKRGGRIAVKTEEKKDRSHMLRNDLSPPNIILPAAV